MPSVDPSLLPLLNDLDRGLRTLGVSYGVVGPLVPALLLDTDSAPAPSDVEAAVDIENLADFRAFRERLESFGFSRRRLPHRLEHRAGGLVDLLPVGPPLTSEGRLRLADDFVFNMAGFGHVIPHALPVRIDGGPIVPVAPLPLHALMALVAFHDRREPKDLVAVLLGLEQYLERDKRRYMVQHEGQGVPLEYASAYLLGADGRRFLDPTMTRPVTAVLEKLGDSYAEAVGLVARSRGRVLVGEQERGAIVEAFGWYRLGLGV